MMPRIPIAKLKGVFTLDCPDLRPLTVTRARSDFETARSEAITLLRIHDQKTGKRRGRPASELEALKTSALVLSVTAWEGFVEDTVVEQLDLRLTQARAPSDLKSAFNSVAERWLHGMDGSKKHGPDLAAWTGDGWKEVIRVALQIELKSFHTPDTTGTSSLFKRYLGVSIANSWSWKGCASKKSQAKLNDLIRRRGFAVHRGKTAHPFSVRVPPIKRSQVVSAMNLVFLLAHATERSLGILPTYR